MKTKAMLTVGLMLTFAIVAAYNPVHAAESYAAQDTVEPEGQVVEEAEIEGNGGHALVAGVNFGGMLPFGQSTKDRFGLGVPFSVVVKVPGLVSFGDFPVGAGIEAGFYTAGGKKEGDLTGIPLMVSGMLDLSSFVPEGMALAAELNLGMHMQKKGDNSYTHIALLPGVCFGYEVMDGLNVIVKLRAAEILSSDGFGGTQEWIGFRIGVEYALPVELPF